MLQTGPVPTSSDEQLVQVERVLAELRAGRPVSIVDEDGTAVVCLAMDGVQGHELPALLAAREEAALLVLTPRRAAALGLAQGTSPFAIAAGELSTDDLTAMADPTRPQPAHRPNSGRNLPQGWAQAALDLTKLARLLPAALVWQASDPGLLSIRTAEVRRFRTVAPVQLRQVAAAPVPLFDATDTRIVAFRPADGGREHLAIIVGDPAPGQPILARIHSECFTGDLLGSLRCDCGDQLRGAIAAMAEAGAGVLLYMAQEGRGIGLVNKLRAYTLQDRGSDTLDANQLLGYDADERVYAPAAEMLRQMGFDRVRLLTNNPEKGRALTRHGIEVAARIPHHFPSNPHNEAYLTTKAARFGHLL